ncbi:MAG: hypothetical protein ABIB43_05445 [archaeon]
MNKRGHEVIANLFGYIYLFLLVIMFYIIASHMREQVERNVGLEVVTDDTKSFFLMFLREPINNEGIQMPISELIMEAEYDLAKRAHIRELITERFDDEEESEWAAYIYYPGESRIIYGHAWNRPIQKTAKWAAIILGTFANKGRIPLSIDETISVSTTLPGYGDESIRITFEKWTILVI